MRGSISVEFGCNSSFVVVDFWCRVDNDFSCYAVIVTHSVSLSLSLPLTAWPFIVRATLWTHGEDWCSLPASSFTETPKRQVFLLTLLFCQKGQETSSITRVSPSIRHFPLLLDTLAVRKPVNGFLMLFPFRIPSSLKTLPVLGIGITMTLWTDHTKLCSHTL